MRCERGEAASIKHKNTNISLDVKKNNNKKKITLFFCHLNICSLFFFSLQSCNLKKTIKHKKQ